jgi:hypothetical protein
MIFPAKRKQAEIQTLPNQAHFAAYDIAAATKRNGPPQARGACLEEIQTFLNRLRFRNHEAANPTMPSPQISRI